MLTLRSLSILLAATGLLLSSLAQAEDKQLDLGIDTEMSWAQSEGAMAAADDARQAAETESVRVKQEKEISKREEKKARTMEANAKVEMAKYAKQLVSYSEEKKVNETRLAKAKIDQDKVLRELHAKEVEVTALHDVVEQIVAERDQTELVVEQAQEKIARLEKRKADELRRRQQVQAGLAKAKLQMAATKKKLSESRQPASKVSR